MKEGLAPLCDCGVLHAKPGEFCRFPRSLLMHRPLLRLTHFAPGDMCAVPTPSFIGKGVGSAAGRREVSPAMLRQQGVGTAVLAFDNREVAPVCGEDRRDLEPLSDGDDRGVHETDCSVTVGRQ